MEPKFPAIEFWSVVQWGIALMVLFALKELAALMVRKKFYESEKHDRRKDTGETRGWIERFLENQREYTQATVQQAEVMGRILNALEQNGEAIRQFTEKSECKFEGHSGRKT